MLFEKYVINLNPKSLVIIIFKIKLWRDFYLQTKLNF